MFPKIRYLGLQCTYLIGYWVCSRFGKAAIGACVSLLFLSGTLLPTLAAEQTQAPVKRVLILPSYNINYPGSQSFLQGVFAELKETPFNIIYYHENLHLALHAGDESYSRTMAEALQIKYAAEKIDLIIVNNKQAVQFVSQYGQQLFGNAPVVFACLEIEKINALPLPANYTGINSSYNAQSNLELIMHNHPGLQKLYIVAGPNATERDMIASTLQEGEKYKDRLEFVVLNDLPIELLLEKLSQPENNAAILYLMMQTDVNNTVIMPAEMARKIGEAARIPAYGILDTYMGSGLVGGFLINNESKGRQAAKIGIDILQGKNPATIPITTVPTGEYRFDWRQLQRWDINEQQLPPGSNIEFRKINIWDVYKWHIIAGICLVLLQSLLIAALLFNRAVRKKTQTALEQNEKQLQQSHQELTATHEELTASYEELMDTEKSLNSLYEEVLTANIKLEESYQTIKAIFNAANDIIIVIDPETGNILDINWQATELFGYSEEEFRQLGVVAIASPDNLEEALRRIRQSVEQGSQLYERQTTDRFGSRIILEVSTSRALIHGKICCLAVMRDISQRKQMEERVNFLSIHDALTGTYNRTYFEEKTRSLQTSEHQNTGIFVCDVDGLKFINDTLGHRYGDELLKVVAGILNSLVSPPDFTARIGGDEFAIVLVTATKPQMERLANQYKQVIADYNRDNPHLPLSLSIGWAIDSAGINIDKLFKEADNNMYRQKIHQQQSIRSSIVQTMMKALEVRDHITEGHAERLSELMEKMALQLELSQASIADLRLFAKFHDIGKVGIPDSILNKPGKLTDEEMTVMRRHCEIGFRIARASPDLAPIADWILKHQEHYDGTGYPLGIAGEDIPVECRILSIIDSFDAMTNDRPYRKAMSIQSALAEIQRCSGSQFDAKLAVLFIEMLEKDAAPSHPTN